MKHTQIYTYMCVSVCECISASLTHVLFCTDSINFAPPSFCSVSVVSSYTDDTPSVAIVEAASSSVGA